MNKKTLILSIAMIVILGMLILIFVLLFANNQKNQANFDPNRTPKDQGPSNLNSTIDSTLSKNQKTQNSLTLIGTNPVESPTVEFSEVLVVTFEFNQIMNKDTVIYEIEPKTDVDVSVEGTKISFLPVTIWENGAHTIRVLSNTRSAQGDQLGKIVEFNFQTAMPPGL